MRQGYPRGTKATSTGGGVRQRFEKQRGRVVARLAAVAVCVAFGAAEAFASPVAAERADVIPPADRAIGDRLHRAIAAVGADPSGAADQFEVLFREETSLRDLLALAMARAWLRAGQAARADAVAARGINAGASPHLRAALEAARAEAAFAQADESAARAAWERALAAAKARAHRAGYRLAIAQSYERSGDTPAAVELYRELWIASPTTDAAEVAAKRLDALEALPGVPQRSARDALARADRLFDAHRNGAALRAYERAIQGPLAQRDARHVAMRRALTLFRTRQYRDAVDAFAAIPGQEALFWRARSLARAGRVEDAIDVFEALADDPQASRGAWSRYLAGILHEGRDRHAQAQVHYQATLPKGGELARNARWRLAWRAYQDGEYERARAHFTRLAKQSADPIERLRPRYWAARSIEQSDPARASAELRAIAREFPLTYYALQARRVLGGEELEPLPNNVRAHPAELGEAELQRPRVAVAAGEFEIATLLLRELRPRAKRIRDRLSLAQLYVEAGDAYPALQLVVVPYSGILARGVDPKLADLWNVAWPRPFAPIVRETAPEGLEASVVWSVMREESGFRPSVESMTGAIGLLQIQPTTGTRLARELGIEPFAARDLAEPQTNVRLGAYYLHQLSARFEGSLPPAIASYNAGAEAVSGWIEGEDDPNSDVWIESIPYSQTRAYVKRVLRSLVLYRDLEASRPVPSAQPLDVAADAAPTGEKLQKPALRAADRAGDEAE